MFVIIGALIVVGSVVKGLTMHGGEMLALHQPSEVLIIFGSAIGTLIIDNPISVIKRLFSQVLGLMKGSKGKTNI